MRAAGILLLLAPIGMIASAAMGDRQVGAMFASVDPALMAGEWTYGTTRLSLKPDGTYHLDGDLAAFKVLVEPKPDGRWRLPLGGNILTLTASNDAAPVEAFVFWYGDQPAIFPFRSEADLDPDVFPPSRFFLKSPPKP